LRRKIIIVTALITQGITAHLIHPIIEEYLIFSPGFGHFEFVKYSLLIVEKPADIFQESSHIKDVSEFFPQFVRISLGFLSRSVAAFEKGEVFSEEITLDMFRKYVFLNRNPRLPPLSTIFSIKRLLNHGFLLRKFLLVLPTSFVVEIFFDSQLIDHFVLHNEGKVAF